jgi:hypothetical protein
VVADRLDPVAVWIAQKRAVIGWMIVAQAGRTVIAAAGGDPRVPERIDLGPRLRLEAPVAARIRSGLRARVDGDVDPIRMVGTGAFAVAQPVVAAANLDDARMTAS